MKMKFDYDIQVRIETVDDKMITVADEFREKYRGKHVIGFDYDNEFTFYVSAVFDTKKEAIENLPKYQFKHLNLIKELINQNDFTVGV
tara:strand:- start:2087 stop:2350 length:264 start_codon:yes stop_codon:yes gene_type:complete